MASSIKSSSGCSPDSTVSSLLTSCSTDSSNPHSDSLICYKGKLYSSASEALEAYIEDFDLSLTSPDVRTGKISMCQSTPKQVKFSKPHAKAKHGLEDFNQQLGLDALASLCPRQAECDPELLSLATDDLLGFPEDGSLPFVQSTPSKPKLPSSEWKRQILRTASCLSQTSPLSAGGTLCLQENGKAGVPQEQDQDFSIKQHTWCPSAASLSLKGSPRPLAFEELSGTWKNYPRWLTSHKAELSVSGITSIPSLHYPLWLSSYSLASHSTNERDGQGLSIQGKAPSSQHLEILKENHSLDKGRAGFLEQKACLPPRGGDKAEECFPAESSFWRHAEKPFREEQLEGVTWKADRQLEGWTEDLEQDSPSTTAILGTERSWEKAPGACNPAVPVCCEDLEDALSFPKADIIQKFLEDCLQDKNKEETFCGGHHPRPLEALKLMLFKLQTMKGNLSQNEAAEQKEEFEKLSERAEDALKLCDREIIPLINSVQKALQHFSHLKSLAEDNRNQQKQTGDQEDKEAKKNYL